MKLSEFKRELLLKISIIKANIWFTFQQEVAYAGNNWSNLFSTTFYTITMLMFINILFVNVKEIAGYSYQEMLLFFFIEQVTYYFTWTFILKNVRDMVVDVNAGNLDMVLIKPVKTLFYLGTRSINLYALARDGLLPSLAILIPINFHSFTISFENLLIGIIIYILGFWILYVFLLVSALPVFWLGESESIVSLALQVSSGNGVLIPTEGYSKWIRITLGTVIPVLFTSAFTTSAILNKTNPYFLLQWTIAVAVAAIFVRNYLWNLALKNYTSASS